MKDLVVIAVDDLLNIWHDGDQFGVEIHTPNLDRLSAMGVSFTNAHVNFERPDWPSGSDQDRELGVETRARLMDQAATDKMRIIGFHLPGGGMGRVERKDGAYRFVEDEA